MRYRDLPPLLPTLAAALLLPAAATAGVQSWAAAETRVQVGRDPVRVRLDPDDRPLRRVDGFTVGAGVADFASTTDPWSGQLMAATASSSFNLEAGLPRMQLLTESDTGGGYWQDAFAYAEAGGLLTITGTISGAPGVRSTMTIVGSFAAAVAPSARPRQSAQGALVEFNAGLVLTGAGQSGCQAQRCQAFARMGEQFQNGSFPQNGLYQPFSLSLDATAGDSFEISFNVAARASNGYFVLIGQPPGVPMSTLAATQEQPAAAPSFAGISGIRLGGGLGLSADSGLELLPDGRWVLPSPVPEPAAFWLLGAGLAVLGLRRRT